VRYDPEAQTSSTIDTCHRRFWIFSKHAFFNLRGRREGRRGYPRFEQRIPGKADLGSIRALHVMGGEGPAAESATGAQVPRTDTSAGVCGAGGREFHLHCPRRRRHLRDLEGRGICSSIPSSSPRVMQGFYALSGRPVVYLYSVFVSFKDNADPPLIFVGLYTRGFCISRPFKDFQIQPLK
jgi:hypothetical protein